MADSEIETYGGRINAARSFLDSATNAHGQFREQAADVLGALGAEKLTSFTSGRVKPLFDQATKALDDAQTVSRKALEDQVGKLREMRSLQAQGFEQDPENFAVRPPDQLARFVQRPISEEAQQMFPRGVGGSRSSFTPADATLNPEDTGALRGDSSLARALGARTQQPAESPDIAPRTTPRPAGEAGDAGDAAAGDAEADVGDALAATLPEDAVALAIPGIGELVVGLAALGVALGLGLHKKHDEVTPPDVTFQAGVE
jgi:hypothetical protein